MKKKIVQVIPSLEIGGAERFVVDLSNALSKMAGTRVLLISLNLSNDTVFKKELLPEVEFIELNKKRGFDIKVFFSVMKILKKFRPNVINTHINALEYTLGYVMFNRVRCFHTLHNDAFKEIQIGFVKWIRWMTFKFRIVKPITISANGSLSFREFYNLSNDAIIENGARIMFPSNRLKKVQVELNNFRNGGYLVLNIARITPQKNQQMLIEAVQILRRKSVKICLVIIGGAGEGEEQFYLQLKQNESDYIHFLGPKENVFDYLLCADAFCLSSVYEGMPISLIEAFQAGCIPICTSVGGVSNMIRNGETGYLSKSISAVDFAEAIMEFIQFTNKDFMKNQCIKEFNNRYHIENVACRYMELYNI